MHITYCCDRQRPMQLLGQVKARSFQDPPPPDKAWAPTTQAADMGLPCHRGAACTEGPMPAEAVC